MFIKNNNLNIKDKNSILLSINCFIKQSWKKEKRELIIFCNVANMNVIKELINVFEQENINLIGINKETDIYEIVNDNMNIIKGNYIALWPSNCWSSPYRLFIQYNALKEEDGDINKCFISPFIKAYPDKEQFFISEDNSTEKSIFSEKKFFINKIHAKIKQINEPTIFIEISDDESSFSNSRKNNKDAIQYLQKRNSQSLFYELSRITNPFLYNNSIIPFSNRRKRRIYILSSELEFFPVVGGINTFLRVIISQLQQSKIHISKETEFVFVGIKTKSSPKDIPDIEGIIFKFFNSEESKNFKSLNEYFKSFKKHNLHIEDLQNFGKKATEWIEKDSIPGDIFISTIIYELNRDSLIKLNKKGIKLIHTVHSLVPFKMINHLKKTSYSRLNWKEKICIFLFMNILRLDEYSLKKYHRNYFLNKIFPHAFKFCLDMEEFIMGLSKIIIVPSKKLSYITSHLYNKNKHKIRYIPWGLPDKHICGEPLINYQKRKSTEEKKCLVLSKIIPQKGIDILLDSFIYIEKINPIFAKNLEINICGDMSYMGDKKFKEIIEEKNKKLKIIKVNWYGWIIGQKKKDILQNSDLFLLPSLIEPFGFCVLEAMKAGLPIVSFDTEGPRDIITNKFGKLIKISDYDTMVKDFGLAIIDICQSDNYDELRNSSAEDVKKWNINTLINNLISV